MSIRKRGDRWLVTAEGGVDEFGVRRRVCRTVASEDEAKRLDAKLQLLDLATGLRRGELLGLRVTDVDLARSRLHVRQALRRGDDGKSEIGPCKTARSRRTIVIPESVISLLAEYAAQRPRTRSQVFFLSLEGATLSSPHAHPFVSGRRKPAPADVNLVELVAGLALTHDALHPAEPLYLREALAAHGVDADHVRVWQTVGKRRRHGLVLRGEPRGPGERREPGYRVEDWTWEAKRVRSSISSPS